MLEDKENLRIFAAKMNQCNMVKLRQFNSIEELKAALAESVSRKKRLELMLRSGASAEEIKAAGINMVPIS